LTTGSWLPVGGPLLGTGSNAEVSDSMGNQPVKFYRVRRLP